MRWILAGCVVALLSQSVVAAPKNDNPAPPAPQGTPLEQALKQAKRDGRPVLVVAGRDQCPLCTSFKKRLSTEASLKPLLANYISTVINVDKPAEGLNALMAKKMPEGSALPFLWLLRPDGEVLYCATGVSNHPMDQILAEGLKKSGRPLQNTEQARAEAALAKAKQALEVDDISQALTALAPLAKSEGYAASVVEGRDLIKKITDEAKRDVANCEQLLADKGDLLPAALLIASSTRKYAKLPEQRKTLGVLARKLNAADSSRELLGQAQEIVRARGHAKSQKTDRAKQSYEQVIKRYPDTPAAKLAAEELKALAQSPEKDK